MGSCIALKKQPRIQLERLPAQDKRNLSDMLRLTHSIAEKRNESKASIQVSINSMMNQYTERIRVVKSIDRIELAERSLEIHEEITA